MGGTAGRGDLPLLNISKSSDDSPLGEGSMFLSPSTLQMTEKGFGPRPRSREAKRMPRITVVVRKRPLTSQEKKRRDTDTVKIDPQDSASVIVEELRSRVDTTKYIEKHEFRVDHAFDETSPNPAIYHSCVKPLIESALLENSRCSCFAYGQTGSGKTYTMLGPVPYDGAKEPGIFELAARDIFDFLENQLPSSTRRFAFVSFYEIYCGKLYDLLQKRKLVAALENGKKEVIVKDLKVERVDSKSVLVKKMIEGVELRKSGVNSINYESSRSHAVLQIDLKRNYYEEGGGKIAFIDLAGSERGADTVNSTRTTQQDGAGINRSLLALKECIRAMDQENRHIPFRDSELTKVLRDIFVGKSRSLMIANISPSATCCEQTLNTMRYATRVKNFRQSISTRFNGSEEAFLGDEGTLHSSKIPLTSNISQDPPVNSTRKKKLDDCETVANISFSSSGKDLFYPIPSSSEPSALQPPSMLSPPSSKALRRARTPSTPSEGSAIPRFPSTPKPQLQSSRESSPAPPSSSESSSFLRSMANRFVGSALSRVSRFDSLPARRRATTPVHAKSNNVDSCNLTVVLPEMTGREQRGKAESVPLPQMLAPASLSVQRSVSRGKELSLTSKESGESVTFFSNNLSFSKKEGMVNRPGLSATSGNQNVSSFPNAHRTNRGSSSFLKPQSVTHTSIHKETKGTVFSSSATRARTSGLNVGTGFLGRKRDSGCDGKGAATTNASTALPSHSATAARLPSKGETPKISRLSHTHRIFATKKCEQETSRTNKRTSSLPSVAGMTTVSLVRSQSPTALSLSIKPMEATHASAERGHTGTTLQSPPRLPSTQNLDNQKKGIKGIDGNKYPRVTARTKVTDPSSAFIEIRVSAATHKRTADETDGLATASSVEGDLTASSSPLASPVIHKSYVNDWQGYTPAVENFASPTKFGRTANVTVSSSIPVPGIHRFKYSPLYPPSNVLPSDISGDGSKQLKSVPAAEKVALKKNLPFGHSAGMATDSSVFRRSEIIRQKGGEAFTLLSTSSCPLTSSSLTPVASTTESLSPQTINTRDSGVAAFLEEKHDNVEDSSKEPPSELPWVWSKDTSNHVSSHLVSDSLGKGNTSVTGSYTQLPLTSNPSDMPNHSPASGDSSFTTEPFGNMPVQKVSSSVAKLFKIPTTATPFEEKTSFEPLEQQHRGSVEVGIPSMKSETSLITPFPNLFSSTFSTSTAFNTLSSSTKENGSFPPMISPMRRTRSSPKTYASPEFAPRGSECLSEVDRSSFKPFNEHFSSNKTSMGTCSIRQAEKGPLPSFSTALHPTECMIPNKAVNTTFESSATALTTSSLLAVDSLPADEIADTHFSSEQQLSTRFTLQRRQSFIEQTGNFSSLDVLELDTQSRKLLQNLKPTDSSSIDPKVLMRTCFGIDKSISSMQLSELCMFGQLCYRARQNLLKKLLSVMKAPDASALEASSVQEVATSLLLNRRHSDRVGDDIRDFLRQSIEKKCVNVLKLRQVWMEAENLKELHKIISDQYHARSAKEVRYSFEESDCSHTPNGSDVEEEKVDDIWYTFSEKQRVSTNFSSR